MTTDYIIVQAGGKGIRLEHLTANKPKALVPVENLPMLFHLFRRFPDKRYIIIADYKKDVLREYLEAFAQVKYQIVDADGCGTCSGLQQALELLPENAPFMLIWSDLILSDTFELPLILDNYVGISQSFPCRWSYENGIFFEKQSTKHGVAGLFILKNRTILSGVPHSGELVQWMQEQGIHFSEIGLAGTKEFGLLSEYETLEKEKCRPFNRITIDGDIFVKEAIDEQGRNLALREVNWYKAASARGVRNIPKVYSSEPLKMERINGKNIYEYEGLLHSAKVGILQKLSKSLKELHSKETVQADSFSVKEAYYQKTMDRLSKIRDLLPFSDKRSITVNGRECRNIYHYKRDFEKKISQLKCDKFSFIHGDCTFSNLMLRDDTEPVFIDPRGYFGHTMLFGDPNYDWAKLYYSIVGNYDRFNLKDFRLNIEEDSITLKIGSNQWEELEEEYFHLSGTEPNTIKLLHAVIWLSLTTYVWQDYDSICCAFYNGLYYLEEVL